jgi:hypothetical protein
MGRSHCSTSKPSDHSFTRRGLVHGALPIPLGVLGNCLARAADCSDLGFFGHGHRHRALGELLGLCWHSIVSCWPGAYSALSRLTKYTHRSRYAVIGEEELIEFSPSLLRTVRTDFPHTALQSVVLPLRRLTGQRMGCFQAVQPVFGKECIRPAMMIPAAPASTSFTSLSEDAPQPQPNPSVQRLY